MAPQVDRRRKVRRPRMSADVTESASGGPVRAVRVDRTVAYRDLTRSAVTTGEPSWSTRDVLLERGLLELNAQRPDAAIDALHRAERPAPEPGPGEVLVRIRASALNYRDLLTILDPESRAIPYPRIPNSDGAGEVLALGPGVTRFAPGDRVAGTFFQRWTDGPITADAMASALGGDTQMLTEWQRGTELRCVLPAAVLSSSSRAA